MKCQLSVVALALLQAGLANAAGFDIANANLDKVNQDKWQCKRCELVEYAGTVGISAAVVDSDDKRAANDFGEDSEFSGALQADAVYHGEVRVSLQAHDLGRETGSGVARFSSEHLSGQLGYQSQLSVAGDDVQSLYAVSNNGLVQLPEAQATTLQSKREQWQLGTAFMWNQFGAYVDYRLLERSGQQASSALLNRSPVNYAQAIDSQTQQLDAGAEVTGGNWLASLHYQGSRYDNHDAGLFDPVKQDALQSYAPDNESHQLIARGQYRLAGYNFTGQFARGWLYQNQDYLTLEGVPNGITHLNGEVHTSDARLQVSTKPAKGLKLRAKVDYRDRDNQTPQWAFSEVNYDPITGVATENVALDRTKIRYLVDGRYRLNGGWQLSAGYQREEVERNHSVREQTDDNRVFAQLNYKGLEKWRFKLLAEHSNRDGSVYQASEVTSSEDNPLLRKYHLADRDRNRAEFKVTHQPLAQLAIHGSYRFAEDDYHNSELGLQQAKDQGYDLALSYQLSTQLSFNLYGGQQWIDSSQLGSQGFSSADWLGETTDSFSHFGASARYQGLLQDKLTLGLDYDYSESESETSVTEQTPYGDYVAWGHRASAYADYLLTPKTTVRAEYQYLRGYDSDYSQVAPEAIPGLISLGHGSSNYHAHQLMLTLSYSL